MANRVALPGPRKAGELPPRAPGPTKFDWAGVRAELEKNPGLWIKALDEVPTGIYTYVRRGKNLAFYGMGGYLEASLPNQRQIDGERGKRGTLWLRWEPEGWTEQDQARAEAAAAAGEGQI